MCSGERADEPGLFLWVVLTSNLIVIGYSWPEAINSLADRDVCDVRIGTVVISRGKATFPDGITSPIADLVVASTHS